VIAASAGKPCPKGWRWPPANHGCRAVIVNAAHHPGDESARRGRTAAPRWFCMATPMTRLLEARRLEAKPAAQLHHPFDDPE